MRKLEDLVQVMDKLLSPNGCPWDREQTPQSLAPFAIEEAHELAEALESKKTEHIKEELGDLMFQVVFHSGLAKRLGQFELGDVIQGICEKLIRRHPHVFGDAKVKDATEVLANWEQIKQKEKANEDKKPFDIPPALPALQRAQKIGEKTKRLKFDWQTPDDVFLKVEEEFGELKEALTEKDEKHAQEELGDLLFVLVQFARLRNWDAETILRRANTKIVSRIEKLLELAKTRNLDFNKISDDEKEKLWTEIKKGE